MVGLLVIYTLAYVWVSSEGQYESTDGYGLGRGKNGESIMIRKGTGELRWVPFAISEGLKWRLYLFYPVIFLDQKFWHTPKVAASGKFPVHDHPMGDPGSHWRR